MDVVLAVKIEFEADVLVTVFGPPCAFPLHSDGRFGDALIVDLPPAHG